MAKQKPTPDNVITTLLTAHVRGVVASKIVKQPGGCARWTGAHSANGRPAFALANPKATMSAYKAVFIQETGRDVTQGLVLCHSCDNEWCVAFEHLEEKPHRNNLLDRYERGRYPSRYKTRLLTDAQVIEIREKWQPRVYSQFALAREYGVSRSVIQGIIEGTKYKDVP